MSRKYTPEFKAKIVLEVLQGDRELGEIAADNNLNPNMLRTWKAECVKNANRVERDGGADKNLDTYRELKGDIDVFRRTEGKGAMYLSSDRICYRYSASTWLSQQRTPVYLDS